MPRHPLTACRLASLLLGALALPAAALAHGEPPAPAAHPAPRMDFVPPAPGSYVLQRILRAPDGTVLDVRGRPGALSGYTRGMVTVLSFMYTHCADPAGCPLAFEALTEVRRLIESDPSLHGRVRLVSLSFDPENDTPQQMALYGSHVMKGRGVRWYFLTPPSHRALAPLLEGFGQDLSPAMDEAGQLTGELSHVLRVFLIDRDGWVREIYSTAWLLPPVVLNDIRTLLMERGGK